MIKVHTFPASEVATRAAAYAFKTIEQALSKGQTLLLVSGGSVAKDLLPILVKYLGDLPIPQVHNLTFALVDERFGPVGHRDSNMVLLKNLGILTELEKCDINIEKVLIDGDNKSLEDVAENYNARLKELFNNCRGRVVGLFGIGPDGHTAGIKPQKDLVTFNALFNNQKLIAGYEAKDFKRITMTTLSINLINQAIIYAVGEEKKAALEKMLHAKAKDIYLYPAILFQSHSQAQLFTDQAL